MNKDHLNRLNLLKHALEIVNYNPTTFSFLYTMNTHNVDPEIIKIIKDASEIASKYPDLTTAEVIEGHIKGILEGKI